MGKKEKMKRSWWISCLILFHSLSMAVTLKRDQAKPGPPSFPFEKGNGNFKPVLSERKRLPCMQSIRRKHGLTSDITNLVFICQPSLTAQEPIIKRCWHNKIVNDVMLVAVVS